MPIRRPIRAYVLVMLACMGMQAAAVEAETIPRLPVKATLTIEADGSVAMVEDLAGASGPLGDAVIDQIKKRTFVPARIDGLARRATTQMTAVVVLKPMNEDEFEVSLEDLVLAPGAVLIKPPLYPAAMVRSRKEAAIEMVLVVGVDGRATFSSFLRPVPHEFAEAIKRTVPDMRFEPQRIDGEPVPVSVILPVWLRLADRNSSQPEFQCSPIDSKRPSASGQSACLDRIEVIASRVRR